MARENPEVRNIIFDLGGVIINLDLPRTIHEFNKISAIPFQELYSQSDQIELFSKFDKGQIGEEAFFAELQEKISHKGDRQKVLDAWNAMLLDIPEHRLDLLVNLKLKYRTFLLSNTNETHVRIIERELYREHGVKNFSDYFEGIIYSYQAGMRKPDAEIFKMVLKKYNLKPGETIFIDDTEQHVKGAGACGIKSYLLPKNMEVADLLKELKLL